MFEYPAVILAGGRSSRMGRDKALMPFGDRTTLAEYQYRRLVPLFTRVYLSAKEEKFSFDAEVIPDRSALHSPLGALESVLRTIATPAVFILAVDMPLVSEPLIRSIVAESLASPCLPIVCAAGGDRPQPLCGVYRRALLPEIERRIQRQEHRLRHLLAAVPHRTISAPQEELLNLNRPEEYLKALSRI